MPRKFFANYSVNNGTTMGFPLEYRNSADAKKDILRMAKGAHFGGTNPGRCWVEDADGNRVFERTYVHSENGKGRWVNSLK